MQPEYLPNYTYEDYIQWEGQWEVIDGIPWWQQRHQQPKHQLITGNLLGELCLSIRPNEVHRVYAPIDYKLDNHTVLNPDVLIVAGVINKPYLDFPPSLVAEVVSDDSRMKDHQIKFSRYETAGIPYYLMVDIIKNTVEVYQLIDGRYKQQAMNPFEPFAFVIDECRFTIRFSNIWD